MYAPTYFYRGVKKKEFLDEFPYSLLRASNAMSSGQTDSNSSVNDDTYVWSNGNFCFRPKESEKNTIVQSGGIMAQIVYYGKDVVSRKCPVFLENILGREIYIMTKYYRNVLGLSIKILITLK